MGVPFVFCRWRIGGITRYKPTRASAVARQDFIPTDCSKSGLAGEVFLEANPQVTPLALPYSLSRLPVLSLIYPGTVCPAPSTKVLSGLLRQRVAAPKKVEGRTYRAFAPQPRVIAR